MKRKEQRNEWERFAFVFGSSRAKNRNPVDDEEDRNQFRETISRGDLQWACNEKFSVNRWSFRPCPPSHKLKTAEKRLRLAGEKIERMGRDYNCLKQKIIVSELETTAITWWGTTKHRCVDKNSANIECSLPACCRSPVVSSWKLSYLAISKLVISFSEMTRRVNNFSRQSRRQKKKMKEGNWKTIKSESAICTRKFA